MRFHSFQPWVIATSNAMLMWYQCNATKKDATKKDATKKDATKKDTTKKDATRKDFFF